MGRRASGRAGGAGPTPLGVKGREVGTPTDNPSMRRRRCLAQATSRLALGQANHPKATSVKIRRLHTSSRQNPKGLMCEFEREGWGRTPGGVVCENSNAKDGGEHLAGRVREISREGWGRTPGVSRGRPDCKSRSTPKPTEQPGGKSPRTEAFRQDCGGLPRAREFHEATQGVTSASQEREPHPPPSPGVTLPTLWRSR